MELESIKKEIAERERERKVKRLFSEEVNLYQEWLKRYNLYYAKQSEKKLFVDKLKLKIVDNREKSLYTDTEALRVLLEKELDKFKIKKLRYRTDFENANKLYFPYLFTTGEFRDIYYKVDISACFYSIYSTVGIDANIVAEIDLDKKTIEIKGIGKGTLTKKRSELIEELYYYKQLRNIVYGLTRACWINVYKPERQVQRQFIRGRLQNLDLTVIIASVLHNFVYKFKEYIVYWNIDGGIIRPNAFEKMKEYLSDIGFNLKKEAEGEAVVLGLGSYKVGEYETEHFKAGVCSYRERVEYLFYVKNAEKLEKLFRRLKWQEEK